jgi:DNA-binding LacI/PurR family transcriptional regulator
VAGSSKTLGVIVSNLENPFFVDIFHTLENDALALGYEILVANTNYNPERLANSLELILGRRVACLAMIVSEQIPPQIKKLVNAAIPIASFDNVLQGRNMTTVRFDYRKGMTQLVEHLHRLGHRRMAYIGHPLHLGPTDERKAAFIESARRLEIEFTYLSVVERDGFQGGRDAVRELQRAGFASTAILCVNDITAVGVLRELRNQGIPVPESVSVTGFDNIALSAFSCPSLTTIDIPRERIARIMFRGLMQDSSEPGDYIHESMIDPELIVRESTGPATILGGPWK